VSKSTPIRVVLFGVGVIGSGVLRLARTRPEIEIAGAVVRDPRWEGRALEAIVPDDPTGLRVSADGARVLRETRPDVVVIATRSTLPEVLPTLRLAAKARAAIACTAEELAYIRPGDGPESAEIFGLADSHQVAIVAVGLNPGFVLDVWPLLLASIAHDVTAIDAERAVDLSGFGPNVRASLGVGYSATDFDRELARGKIAGHRGFRESLRLIGEGVGRPVDQTNVETSPIFAKRARTLIGGELSAGQTAGVRQLATGSTAGAEWLRLTMTASVALDEIGVQPVDRVHISGSNDLTAVISPGSRAVPSTVGRIVNAIPKVAVAAPGIHSAADLGLTPARAVR
jgi:2,4-diaminopentanoate dehydrogenase